MAFAFCNPVAVRRVLAAICALAALLWTFTALAALRL